MPKAKSSIMFPNMCTATEADINYRVTSILPSSRIKSVTPYLLAPRLYKVVVSKKASKLNKILHWRSNLPPLEITRVHHAEQVDNFCEGLARLDIVGHVVEEDGGRAVIDLDELLDVVHGQLHGQVQVVGGVEHDGHGAQDAAGAHLLLERDEIVDAK